MVEKMIAKWRKGLDNGADGIWTEISVDDGSAPLGSALEDGMLDKMGYAAMVPLLVSGAAFNAQSAVSH